MSKTLLDEFAMNAPPGIIVKENVNLANETSVKYAANLAYKMAEVMMRVRVRYNNKHLGNINGD